MSVQRLQVVQQELDAVMTDLDAKEKYDTYYDDLLLVRFLKGVLSREIVVQSRYYLVPEQQILQMSLTEKQKRDLEYSKSQLEYIALQADSLHLDHWILPFSRYELGTLHIRMGDYDQALNEFSACLAGGYGVEDFGFQKRKVSMEQSLHLKAHNAINKIQSIRKLLDKGEESDDSTNSIQ